MEYRLIYITTSNAEEAERIGRALVESRLAACANILPTVRSLYWWEGSVQEDVETVLIAKTRESHVAALTEMVRGLHSYSCPCVVALPITGGNPAYLDWLAQETTLPKAGADTQA